MSLRNIWAIHGEQRKRIPLSMAGVAQSIQLNSGLCLTHPEGVERPEVV